MRGDTRSSARRTPRRRIVFLLLTAGAIGCGATRPLDERRYPDPVLTARGTEVGRCSWYGPGFHGRKTASGETYDQNAMTAAHRTLPLGTFVEVTDTHTGRSVIVRINDRGPYHQGRVLDLSYGAARRLGIVERGVADVEIRVLGNARSGYPRVRYAVQVGAFRNRREADRLARRLRAAGAQAYVVGGPLYRVRVGSFKHRDEAKAAAHSLSRKGYRGVIVEAASDRT